MRDARRIAQQVHRTRGAKVIAADPACRWLAGKNEILDELGRIDNDYALLTIAKRVVELKPSTPEAVDMIRRHREFDQLADEIVHTVNDYSKRHPATTRHDILHALESAAMMLGKVLEPEDVGRHQFLRKPVPA